MSMTNDLETFLRHHPTFRAVFELDNSRVICRIQDPINMIEENGVGDTIEDAIEVALVRCELGGWEFPDPEIESQH